MFALRSLWPVVAALLLGLGAAPAAADSNPAGVWPLRPVPAVIHDFDPPADPWGSGHRGVDLAGGVGQPVRSAMPGTIAFVGLIAGKPVVTVSHGETRTTYEPVPSNLRAGDQVLAGQRIGTLELAFSHCFPLACLHWGWLQGDDYLNPLDLVSTGRVRLLPLWRDAPADSGGLVAWQPASLAPPLLPWTTWSPWPLLFAVRPGDVPAGRPAAADRW